MMRIIGPAIEDGQDPLRDLKPGDHLFVKNIPVMQKIVEVKQFSNATMVRFEGDKDFTMLWYEAMKEAA